jgi:fatty acid synthase, animal type
MDLNFLIQFIEINFSGVLSSDGYCKPFDKEGTGYMRSDTISVVYLQNTKDARRVYATFVCGKTNCDGFVFAKLQKYIYNKIT